ILFGILTSGAACFAVICIYQLSDLSSMKRSRAGQSALVAVRGLMPGLEVTRTVLFGTKVATPTGDDQRLLPRQPPPPTPRPPPPQRAAAPARGPAAASATPRGIVFLGALGRGSAGRRQSNSRLFVTLRS